MEKSPQVEGGTVDRREDEDEKEMYAELGSWEAARRRMRGARVGFPLQMLTENRYRQRCAEVEGGGEQ